MFVTQRSGPLDAAWHHTMAATCAVATLVLTLTACGGGSLPTAKPDASADTWKAPDVAAPDPAPVTKTLGAEGGAVEHKSGAKLKVPAGALPADVDLTVQAVPPPAQVEAAGAPLGPALQLGPEGQTFAAPVQIAVPVDPAAVVGLDPEELQIVLAPSAGGEFVGLDTIYDAKNNQLLAETTHFSIAVPVKRKGPPLVLQLPASLPAAKVGEVYGPLDLKASGGKAPYSWSVNGGALPPGLALSPLGSVSGIPAQAGPFAASVRVKDTGGQLLEKAIAFTVDGPPNDKPTLTAMAPSAATAGSGDTVVAVKGNGLVQGALVTVDGKGVPTQFVSAQQVNATVPAAKLANEGTLQIAAVNPAPGGGASNALPFVVTTLPVGGDAVGGDTVGGDVEDAGSTGDAEVVGGEDTADGAADATPVCVPKPEVCDGQDNDCNGQTDEASCDDGDPCTTGDACANAKCNGKAKDCADSDACTVDSCNGADGKCENLAFEGCGLPCAATADCKEDANPCAVAACQAGKCAVLIGKAACDDNNLCTDDACDSKTGCANTANAAPCTDSKVCLQGDTCANKACAAGKVSLCDDGNSCTLDTCSEASGCSYQPTSGACDDGDGCTVGEGCADGGCKGAVAKNCDDGKPCTLDSCDPGNGNCAAAVITGCGEGCKVAGDCKDDGNPCTQATCVTDACGVTPTTATCDDGDPCTSADACAVGVCSGTVDACDDGNSCTADSCGNDGKCSSSNQAGECNDGDACTIFDACGAGLCKAGGAANCDDGNACTDDSCAAKLGCQHPDSKSPCSDSNPCTVGDACKDAGCKPTGPKDCSDGDNCTLDACDAVDGSCDVTLLEGCGGFCNTPKDCKDDGNPCTDWACPTGKCEVSYNGQPCDDSDACSEKDTCDKGKCAGAPVDCNDKNVCSDDSCDVAKGCVHLANAATCTDGAVCTVADVCKDQACQTGPAADCDDLNACTFDTCSAEKGCVHTTGGQACSDGNPCTQGDACVGASCIGGTSKTCDDSNGCTADSCSVVSGACVYAKVPGCGAGCAADKDCVGGLGPCLPLACSGSVCAAVESTATCDDGSGCTSGDVCADGACTGKVKDCNDANGCTADSCDAKKGCQYAELSGACEDGDLCSVMDQCQAGVCKGGPVQQCGDSNPCTVDGCDSKSGCQFANGAGPCDDANPCTSGDQCTKGACLAGDPSPCDDGKACTADNCDAKTGQCGHSDIAGCGAACQGDGDCKDDGNPCTASVCENGACSLAASASACDDANPCTIGDACKGMLCQGGPIACNDGNPCTDDGCDAKIGCVFAGNKAPCATGNVCLTGQTCGGKVCGGGQPSNCDDGNSCTLDQCLPKAGCQHTATNAPCDDGSPCSIEDECGDGVCIGGTYLPCDDGDGCTADNCDTAKGGCVFTPLLGCGKLCSASKDCPADENPCTEGVCAAGVCVVAFVDQPCNDGDACSSGDLCSGGTCGGTENACDDGNACTIDTCLGGVKGCSHALAKGPCDDGSACTTADVCAVGVCKGQGVLTCDDGNPCSADGCDPKLGCTHAAGKGGCDDGNPCTKGDTCANFGCAPGAVLACDDGKPCTFDACDPATGKCASSGIVGCGSNCQATADCAATGLACATLSCEGGACKLAVGATTCDDANACTAGDTCAAGLCVGAPQGCDDNNTCTLDSCVAKTGCAHSPANGPCDDGNACTSGAGCSQGACAPGKAIACGDANPCTDDTCKPTVGCVYLANDVTCDDGNVCTTGDACSGQYCMGNSDKDCSDGNPCTLDGCATAKGCIHAPSEAACNDGDACTKGDVCLDNSCTAGKPVNCDDGETCTDDSCDKKTGCVYAPKPGACSDNDPCTVGDVCLFGNCVPGQDKDCSDNNGCTADSCSVALGCVHTDTTDACDDGDACTKGDACAKGACVPGKAVACNDDNPCTDDSCDKAGGCNNVANQATCSDGNACTAGDNCKLGTCTAGSAVNCDDSNPCTAEKCDPQKGCALLPLDITCTDDSACTTTDTCKDGDCIPGPKLDCDDGKVCTDDSCDKVKGCVQLANTATCTDDSVCTTDDGCKDGACLPGAPTSCDDKNPCTDDTCDKVKGCANVQSTKPCSDGDACTNKDTCANGKCVAVAVNCDDGNACTSESCDPVKGCANEPIDVVCSDGDACTAIDKCVGLQCVAGTTVQCDDKNVCTDDSCDKAKGCVNAANTKACNDSSVCTTSDACAGGKCGGTEVGCNDNNACTDDSCDKVEGCVNLANTITCTDGDACTTGDACTGGACLTGKSANCDDGNACTDDSCDNVKGCQSTNNTAQCSDSSVCTTGDACTGGTCKGTTKSCDDSNACTDDSCDAVKGCQNVANQATNCDDGNACTKNDACAQGKCGGAAIACSDGQACTLDTCVPTAGCAYVGSAALCSDGDPCTVDSCDKAAGCKNTTAADGAACLPTDDACPLSATCQAGKCVAAAAPKPVWKVELQGDLVFITPTSDGYFVGTGNNYNCGGGGKLYKLDKAGKTVWTYQLGSYMRAARLTKSGNVVVAAEDYGNPQTLRIALLTAGGSKVWEKSTQAVWPNGATLGIAETSYGYATLYRSTASALYRWDANGEFMSYVALNPKAGYDFFNARGMTVDGANIVASGNAAKSTGGYASYVMVVNENGGVVAQTGFSKGVVDASGEEMHMRVHRSGNVYVTVGAEQGVTGLNVADLSLAYYKPLKVVGTWGGARDFVVKNGDEIYVSGDTKPGAKWLTGLYKADSQGNFKWLTALDGTGGQSVAVDGDSILVGSLADQLLNCKPTLTKVESCPSTKCNGVTCNDDGIACTVTRCDAVKGCVHDATDSVCEDGNPCTTNVCDLAKGCTVVDSAATYCDDKNPCTTESCDPAKGCAHANNTLQCNDSDACTINDVCAGGKCAGAAVQAAAVCYDNNPCTQDLCDAKVGCTNPAVANGTVCSPNDDACPANPVCTAGVCAAATKSTWTTGFGDEDIAMVAPMGTGSVLATSPAYGSQGVQGKVHKVDRNGVTEWTYTAGGAGVYAAQPTTDGNVVYAWYCNRIGLLDSKGKKKWEVEIPCNAGHWRMRGVTQVTGGYIAANQGDIVGLDDNGTVLWKILSVNDGQGHYADIHGLIRDGNQVVVYGRILWPNGWYAWAMTTDLQGKNAKQNTWGNADGDTVSVAKWNSDYVFLMTQSGQPKFLYANANLGSWGSASVDVGGVGFGGAYGIAKHPTEANSFYLIGESKPSGKQFWGVYYAKHDVGGSRFWFKTRDERPAISVATGDGMLLIGTRADAFVQSGKLIRTDLDGNGSTTKPTCSVASKCSGVTCDDSINCTLDSCSAATGCVYTANHGLCDDNNLCTADSCDAATGCKNADNGSGACDDKNPCTTDSCDPVTNCTSVANTAPCEDGNACTVGDTCGGKACLAGAAKNCEDGIACTSHGCDSKTGCKQTPNNSKCDDKKQCTADTCEVAKGCTYGPDTKLCDDANLCTDDLCDNAAGCSHVANAVLCNDGNACTTADACAGGLCKGPKAVVCDDLKECTTDSCDPASGCKVANKSNSTSCTPSTSCSDVATCGGDGNCYDGPSKFWVKGLDVLKGGLSPNAMKLMPDGNGFVYIRNDHGGDSTATLRRADKYGNTVWEQTAFPARMQAVAVTSNNNTEMHFGGIRGNNANALYEIRDGNTGNLKGGWEFTDSGYAYIMDIAYDGKTTNAFWAVYQAGSGANANIKLARLDTKEPKPFYSGSHEDQPAALVFDSDVPVVVGATKSLSGGTYQAYYQVGQFDSPHVVANGQFYDAIQMNGVWAIGYGNDGGPNYMLLARITNGLLVKKITQVDWGESLASNGSAMWAVGATGNIGKIVKLSMAGDVDWVNSYSVPNLNGRLVAIQAYSNQYLLAVGTSYNGANGQSILTGVKANQDGVANCTDKNPCASLAANACDDKIACTADACDFKEGCLHFASDIACNDGNPCTNNTCDAAKGCLFPLNNKAPCNDNNACTVDSCDAAAAKCVFTLDIAKACNDNDACTIDNCEKPIGCWYGSVSCNDNNPCTDESAGCDAKTGCSHVSLDNKPCDDGLFCTVEDFCVVGKCAGPNVCDLPANNSLVLHLDARVSNSLVMSGKKVAVWHGVKAGSSQLTGAAVFGDFNTPEVVTEAINGKTAVDLTFANLNVSWPSKDEWTAMAVFKNDKNPSGVANLMFAQPWSVNIYGVDCTLSYNKGVVSGASSSTPTVPYGQPRIAVLRVTKAGAVMYVFGGLQAETGSIPMEYAPLGSMNGLKLKTVTLGALQIYDKALSSAEMAVAVADLKQDWGFVGKCKLDTDCNDADGCTKDTCDAVNGCQATPITTNSGNISCDDGNACSQSKNCNNGVCVAATTKDCNDNNPCTADSCNPYNGKCVNVPAEGSPKCDDGNACTEEYCSSGECKKSNKLCDDNNLCTDDSCDPKSGCKTAHNAAACDDGIVCTSSDICTLGICKGLANTVPCNDFNPCTTADTCANGGCAGKDIVCPDKDENVCTVETCSVFTGCKVTSIKTCYDGKICTNDFCDVKSGTCVYINNNNPCSDGELCTMGDFCAGGKCNSGKLNDCDDVDICTTDKCVSNVGCSNAYSPKCEDGSLCSVDDLCAFGFCLAGAPPNCDDGNTCTNDFCDPAKGCGHSNVADGAACSDGLECTLPDLCAMGSCVPGPKVCDYAVTNTEDSGAGSLRNALFLAELEQGKVSGGGKFPAVSKIRTFLGGKLTLQSPLPTIYYDKMLETNGETFIIDGATKYRPLFSTAQELTIKNIKFQNCAAKVADDSKEGWGLDGNGACIAIQSGSGYWSWTILTLVDVSFYNGIAEKGGGALFASSPYGKEAIVKMTGGTVIKNMAQTATSEKSASGMTVWADGGGGVRVVGTGASFTANNVRFDYNISAGLGGALWCGGGATCDVNQASFYGGIAKDGAVAVSANSKLTLTNVTITANEPGNLVSGLYSKGTTVLRHVTIAGNSALIGKDQVAAYFDGDTTIVNSVLSESGSSATESDCLKGQMGNLTISNSHISVSTKLPGWGPDGYGYSCTMYGKKPAKLGSAKLEGNVRVMWPTIGSPVIDKADLKACMSAPVSGLDALGNKRFKGNGCDIGAVEHNPLK